MPKMSILSALGESISGTGQRILIITLLFPPLWPFLTLLTMLIFRVSMRRARVKPIHMLRCAIYTFDLTLWFGILWVCISTAQQLLMPTMNYYQLRSAFHSHYCLWLLIVTAFGIWRLRSAFAHYLRFDHPLATAFASQALILLLYANALDPIDVYRLIMLFSHGLQIPLW